jgi:hypothetical protein
VFGEGAARDQVMPPKIASIEIAGRHYVRPAMAAALA